MKKFILLPLLVLLALQVSAQNLEEAKAILDKMSKKYKAMSAFKATFSWELSSQVESIEESFKGEVTVKDNKYRLDLGDQEIFNDQRTVWTYLKEENEVTITEYEPDPEELTITQMYSIYEKGYKYLYLGEETIDGIAYNVIDLTPEDRELSFFRIQLRISKDDSIIKSWKIFERNGRIYTYKIDDFKANIEVSDQDFVFSEAKHPDVEVVDLR